MILLLFPLSNLKACKPKTHFSITNYMQKIQKPTASIRRNVCISVVSGLDAYCLSKCFNCSEVTEQCCPQVTLEFAVMVLKWVVVLNSRQIVCIYYIFAVMLSVLFALTVILSVILFSIWTIIYILQNFTEYY